MRNPAVPVCWAVFCLFTSSPHCFSSEPNPWAGFQTPSTGTPEAIGNYDAGCLRGAEKLSDKNPGFQIMRPSRRRFYAHPDLRQFIEDLAIQTSTRSLGILLIGDAGQPRGGPSLSGHASHQIGLDADLWYWRPLQNKPLTFQERNTLSAPRMVVPDFERLTRRWRPDTMEILKLAAEDPRVDRIFVNPVIKREVCKAYAGQTWARKLRPWWSHDEHFHIRLLCPKNNPQCFSKEDPLPEGDGCGADLDSWFTPERRAKARYMRAHPEPSAMPVLPEACKELLKP